MPKRSGAVATSLPPAKPLREVEAIASRGPMPVTWRTSHLLHARIALGDRRHGAGLRHHRDERGGVIIEKHGCGGSALPELALLYGRNRLRGERRPSEAAIAAAIEAIRGEPYYDERTGIEIDGGWWDLLPRLEALLPGDDTAELFSARARDAYNERARRLSPLDPRRDEIRDTIRWSDPIGVYLDAQDGGRRNARRTEFPEISDELVLFFSPRRGSKANSAISYGT